MSRNAVPLESPPPAIRWQQGDFEVVAALGLPRRAVRLLPRVVAAIPPLLPRRTVRAVIRGLTALAYQRLRLAKSAGWVGRRVRRRAAAAIAGRGPHYRSWGRDLGLQYRCGAVMDDGMSPPRSDPEFYTPCASRRPAAAQLDRDRTGGSRRWISQPQRTHAARFCRSHTAWSLADEGFRCR
jgi:hypothetical protein